MKKYTTKPGKVHLNSVMETKGNHLIMKNIGQIQNFQRNTGDLKSSNPEYNFTFQKNTDQQKEQVFLIYL